MNKTDFRYFIIFYTTAIILFIETLMGLETALELFIGAAIVAVLFTIKWILENCKVIEVVYEEVPYEK